ncbi:MAG: acetylglutamate kinase [Gammaproteobacteria bacterium WSBS_2016_MAG_OTU1]
MSEKNINDIAHKVSTLSEALPYIRRYHGKTIVIKYGGNAMTEAPLQQAFARDVALLKLVGINPVVVHGGGPQINTALRRMGLESRFVEGMRYTDSETMDIVEMVLGGLVNQQIVQMINDAGARAVGLTGKDGGLLRARRMKIRKASGDVDIGQVGEVENVDAAVVSLLDSADFIPVIAPIGVDDKGGTLNINADLAAAHIAVALGASALFLLTNTAGVLDKKQNLIAEITTTKARGLLRSGVIAGGMKPKVECALAAVSDGVGSCRIINGTVLHALLLEIFTDAGVGTQIVR